MTEAAITEYLATFAGIDIVVASQAAGSPEAAWGDSFFIYDPERNLTSVQRFPFATIVVKDYAGFDTASNLNRPGVFRLNVGVSKGTYRALFGPQPTPAAVGEVVATGHDFAILDRILPHPVYATQSWICVLNPSEATFQVVRPFLVEAYDLAVRKVARRRAE